MKAVTKPTRDIRTAVSRTSHRRIDEKRRRIAGGGQREADGVPHSPARPASWS